MTPLELAYDFHFQKNYGTIFRDFLVNFPYLLYNLILHMKHLK